MNTTARSRSWSARKHATRSRKKREEERESVTTLETSSELFRAQSIEQAIAHGYVPPTLSFSIKPSDFNYKISAAEDDELNIDELLEQIQNKDILYEDLNGMKREEEEDIRSQYSLQGQYSLRAYSHSDNYDDSLSARLVTGIERKIEEYEEYDMVKHFFETGEFSLTPSQKSSGFPFFSLN